MIFAAAQTHFCVTPQVPQTFPHPLEVRVGDGLKGAAVQYLQLVYPLRPPHGVVQVKHKILAVAAVDGTK